MCTLTLAIFAGGIYLAILGNWPGAERSFSSGVVTAILTAVVSRLPGEHKNEPS